MQLERAKARCEMGRNSPELVQELRAQLSGVQLVSSKVSRNPHGGTVCRT